MTSSTNRARVFVGVVVLVAAGAAWFAGCGDDASTGGPLPDSGPDSGGGGWGPCSLAAAGHPAATAITPRAVGVPRTEPYGSGACDATVRLFGNPADYEAFERARHPDAGPGDTGLPDVGDGGASDALPPDAATDGGPYATLIDWSKESLLVIVAQSSSAFTQGTEGDAIVVAEGKYCQGMAPQCTESAYAVPKLARVVTASCPPPGEPCLAP